MLKPRPLNEVEATEIFRKLYALKRKVLDYNHVWYNVTIRHTSDDVFNFDFWWNHIKQISIRVESMEDVERCDRYLDQTIRW